MTTTSDQPARVREARAFLAACRVRVDERLDELIPAATVEPVPIHSAIRWSLFAGGKRLRPALVLAAGQTFAAASAGLAFANLSPTQVSGSSFADESSAAALMDTACAFEMIHTYSLIHDDLPAMDDDELRRGRPTCHVRFGEATAILAGDALQALAFQIVAADERLAPEKRVRVIAELARAAGTPAGMVAGQAFDLAAEARGVTGAELERIHRRKTGALITAAARCGALIGGASAAELAAITAYAENLGLLFQITDDLLDVTATAADLGKTPGKDARARKATYPALYGIEAARERAASAYERAAAALQQLAQPASLLRALACFVLERHA